jgi:hypothetical protein
MRGIRKKSFVFFILWLVLIGLTCIHSLDVLTWFLPLSRSSLIQSLISYDSFIPSFLSRKTPSLIITGINFYIVSILFLVNHRILIITMKERTPSFVILLLLISFFFLLDSLIPPLLSSSIPLLIHLKVRVFLMTYAVRVCVITLLILGGFESWMKVTPNSHEGTSCQRNIFVSH